MKPVSIFSYSFVPIHKFVKDSTLRSVAADLKQRGDAYYEPFVDMLIFDALICNEDRHFGNFGLTVDSLTNEPYGFAPLFDHGLSLFNYGMPDDFERLEEYAKTRVSSYGVPFETIAKEFITSRQKEQLRRMIGFRFVKDKNYNLPAKRLKAIETRLQSRVRFLLNM